MKKQFKAESLDQLHYDVALHLEKIHSSGHQFNTEAGSPTEGSLFQEDYREYYLPIIEENGEDEWEHNLTAIERKPGVYEVDLTLSY